MAAVSLFPCAARLAEMDDFARGQGDAPMVLKRSGCARPGHIEDARRQITRYLGLACRNATGVAADPIAPHRWLASAARSGHAPAPRELEQLDQMLDSALLAKARAQGPRTP